MLQVPHLPQTNPQGRNSCVPAVVRMVLASQGLVLGEEALCDLLETHPAGTEVFNVLLLTQHLTGCRVEVTSASFDDLERWLQQGLPPIVFVATEVLPYWQTACLHALVVVGIEEHAILVHDPAFEQAPFTVPRDAFLAAWGELAQLTALIRISRSEP